VETFSHYILRSHIFCQFPHLWHFITACTSRHLYRDDMMAIILLRTHGLSWEMFQGVVEHWRGWFRKLGDFSLIGINCTRLKISLV
jgi:hypothetical protein